MIETNSKWTDHNGKIFYVSHVQDGVVYYRNEDNPYACSVEAFLQRFRELVQ
jgi:hypothetical protein